MRGVDCADVVVIGAGASGLMAACAATGKPDAYNTVIILERNERPGRKLSITGKGRCNITNNAEKEQFMRNIPGNGKFLFSAFSKLSNLDIVAFFEGNGVGVALERGGRYFTESGSAREVTEALVGISERQGVQIICGARVTSASVEYVVYADDDAGKGKDAVAGICAANADTDAHPGCNADGNPTDGNPTDINPAKCNPVIRQPYRFLLKYRNGQALRSRCIIIATGGVSYPATGSTGDGYRLAESFGHTVIQPRPSLVPLETAEGWRRELTGLSLKNVTLKMFSPDGRKLFSKLGEMLFTHFGVSGPLVLSASRALLDHGFTGCIAKIDLKPGLSDEKLRARILRDFEMFSKKSLKNAMSELLPSRLIPVVIASAGFGTEQRADSIGKAGAAKLSEAMKGLAMTISAARPMSEAIITAGGVNVNEINPATMESKIVPGLFFCGEVIDVDAYTGGFNLSIAFATGHVAGQSAAKYAAQSSLRA